MIEFLEREHRKQPRANVPTRRARVQVIVVDKNRSNRLFELDVDLNGNTITNETELHGKHSHIDAGYMAEVEAACNADPRVQEEIKHMNLPAGSTVMIEPWAYATDGMNDMTERTTMVCYALVLLGQR